MSLGKQVGGRDGTTYLVVGIDGSENVISSARALAAVLQLDVV
jgi:hypothetical protein